MTGDLGHTRSFCKLLRSTETFFLFVPHFLNRYICVMSALNWQELTQCFVRLGSTLRIAYSYLISNIFSSSRGKLFRWFDYLNALVLICQVDVF